MPLVEELLLIHTINALLLFFTKTYVLEESFYSFFCGSIYIFFFTDSCLPHQKEHFPHFSNFFLGCAKFLECQNYIQHLSEIGSCKSSLEVINTLGEYKALNLVECLCSARYLHISYQLGPVW
jgi:hypothetical protein